MSLSFTISSKIPCPMEKSLMNALDISLYPVILFLLCDLLADKKCFEYACCLFLHYAPAVLVFCFWALSSWTEASQVAESTRSCIIQFPFFVKQWTGKCLPLLQPHPPHTHVLSTFCKFLIHISAIPFTGLKIIAFISSANLAGTYSGLIVFLVMAVIIAIASNNPFTRKLR